MEENERKYFGNCKIAIKTGKIHMIGSVFIETLGSGSSLVWEGTPQGWTSVLAVDDNTDPSINNLIYGISEENTFIGFASLKEIFPQSLHDFFFINMSFRKPWPLIMFLNASLKNIIHMILINVSQEISALHPKFSVEKQLIGEKELYVFQLDIDTGTFTKKVFADTIPEGRFKYM